MFPTITARADGEDQLYYIFNQSSGELQLYYGEQQENAVLANVDGYESLVSSSYSKEITKLKIDASVADYPLTSTNRWFCEWCNLSEIEGLTYLKTSNVTDMERMFQGCSKLKSLDLSEFDTKNVTNMNYMFEDCSNLEVVYVGGNWNPASVTSSKDMFYGCEVLYGQNGTECLPGKLTAEYAHIDDGVSKPGYFTGVNQNAYKPAAPEGKQAYAVLDGTELTFRYDNNKPADAYPLTKFGSPWPSTLTKVIFDASFADYYPISCDGWFSRCSDLTEIVDMEKYLNTDEVLSMHWMFTDCGNLANINLSHFNTEKVTDMCAMFVGCPASLDVSKFKTDNVTDMSDMFRYCSGITTLDLSGFNTANVTDMSGMFANCRSLTTIYVGDQWFISNELQSASMFSQCTSLKGGANTPYNSEHTDATYARIDDPEHGKPGYFTYKESTQGDNREAYAVFDATTGTLTFKYDTQKPNGAYLVDENHQWSDNSNEITKVVFDNSFANYKPTSTNSWFWMCRNLTEIDGITNLHTEDVTDMQYMFTGCSSLKELNLSGFDISKVQNMTMMFNNCTELQTIFVKEDWNTTANCEGLFTACLKLYGENGSIYDYDQSSNPDFACIDGGPDKPGYFTKINNQKAKVISMELTSPPQNTVLGIGERELPFGGDNAFLTVKFDNGVESQLHLNYCEITGYDYSKPGKQILTAHYYDATADFEITVENRVGFYGRFDELTNVLTLYYGEYQGGTLYEKETSQRIYYQADLVKIVVFDKSMTNFKPKSCNYWFYDFRNLTEIVNMEKYLNTEDVTDMSFMFSDCSSLKELNLSTFDTRKVKNMTCMFADVFNPTNLTTIYVGDKWSTESLVPCVMFFNCTNLVGGKGTKCNETTTWDNNDYIYARIDDPDSGNPGYFTYKASTEPYALLTDNGETVTFYYDANKSQHQDALGFDFDWSPGWKDVKVAIFDESFKDYKPTSCENWFYLCLSLTEIRNLDYLNTENVTNMINMFSLCNNLTEVDLSSFDNSKVTNAAGMFYFCPNLTTIYVGDTWHPFLNLSENDLNDMFYACPTLTGGQGTLYSESNHENELFPYDTDYARIDGGESAPGYFTRKGTTKPEVKSIAITTLPKTEYVLGEELNTDNGELAVTIGNRNPQPHDFQGATVTGYDKTKEGKQTLTVEFLGATTTYDIEIASVAPTDTTLTAPAKLSYLEGEELDLTDGKITIIYNNKTTESVALTDAAITLSAFDNTLIGEQVISVLYNGIKVGEFTVSVVKPEPKPENPYTQPEVKENVYQISSAEELLYFMFDVNNGNVSANAVLLNDIVVNADLFKQIADLLKRTTKAGNALNKWIPIGTAENPFRGTFDGNGHIISGIYFKDETQSNVGLFGNVGSEAVIKNLGVTDSYISGNENVGAICGKSEGTIVNCYTVSEVVGNKNVNPLVGAKENTAVVENCYYLAEESNPDDPCAKTAEQFKSGEVAAQLAKGATINGVTYSGESFEGLTELPGTEDIEVIPEPEPEPENPPTPVSEISQNSNINVWSYNHTIFISNAPDAEYRIIDLNGRLITTSTTKSTREVIRINKSGVLIVIIGTQSFKVTL